MRLIETASRWGNMYNFRYYHDGRRISKDVWEELYNQNGAKLEGGVMENTDFGFRKIWCF